MQSFDVVIVGAGAAGLFCAGVAGQLGLKVLVLDHSEKVAEKIRISGGGRANFTNMDVTANNFLSDNPRFAKSALSRFTPADFVALVKKHGIADNIYSCIYSCLCPFLLAKELIDKLQLLQITILQSRKEELPENLSICLTSLHAVHLLLLI